MDLDERSGAGMVDPILGPAWDDHRGRWRRRPDSSHVGTGGRSMPRVDHDGWYAVDHWAHRPALITNKPGLRFVIAEPKMHGTITSSSHPEQAGRL